MITVADLDGVDDPLELFELSTKAISEHQQQIDRLAAIRARAIAALHAQGASYKELADRFGLSAPRVGQLINSNDAAAMGVLRAYVSLERLMVDVAGTSAKPHHRPSFSSAIRILTESGIADDRMIHDIEEIRRTRNDIVHGRGDLSIEQAEHLLLELHSRSTNQSRMLTDGPCKLTNDP